MKTLYYTDELEDDFAKTNIDSISISEDYKWIHKSFLWELFANFLYFVIAYPIVKIINKLYFGLKVKNKAALKQLKHSGFFLYGNHTQYLDPFIAAEVAGFKRTYFLAGPDTFSISGIKHLVAMLGAMPIASDFGTMKKMVQAISTRYKQNACITIFPEAHIWPYYNDIRPFKNTSFSYPVNLNAPVVAMVVTYRKRTGISRFFFKHPLATVHCSNPFYPDNSLSRSAAKEKLRNQVYCFMKDKAGALDNVAFVQYIKRD